MDNKLSVKQMDLLREIATIGAGKGATALADLVGGKVEISVPNATFIPLQNISILLGDVEKTFFVLDLEIKGDMAGRIFLLFSPNDALFLSSNLLGRPKEELGLNDVMFQSALCEVANILCGSYLSALSELSGLYIVSGVPSLAVDMVGAILDFIFIQVAQYSEDALFIKTDLKVKGLNLEGLFLLFPDTESLKKIFEVLGLKE